MPQQIGMMMMMVKVMMLSMRGDWDILAGGTNKKNGSERPTSHGKKGGNK